MTKWVVLILAAIYTLQLLAYHAWSDLMVVWTSIGAAFLFIEMHGAGPELPWWDALKTRFAPRPKFHVVPKMRSSRSMEPDDVYASIDPILDKISKFGIGDRKSTRLNSSHSQISYAVFCLKKKKQI